MYDERFALTFIAQIDLAELPVIESSGLPRSGTLYFFSDTNNDAPNLSDGRVLYYSGDAAHLPVRDLPPNTRPYGIGGEPWPWLAQESVWARTNFRFPLEFAQCDSFRDHYIDDGVTLPPRVPPRRNKEASGNLLGSQLIDRFGPVHSGAEDRWEIFRRDRDDWPFAWVAIEFGARAIAHAARKALASPEAIEAASVYRRIDRAAVKWVERAANEVPHARPSEETRAAFLSNWRKLAQECASTSERLKIYGADPARDLLNVLLAACYVCTSHDAPDGRGCAGAGFRVFASATVRGTVRPSLLSPLRRVGP